MGERNDASGKAGFCRLGSGPGSSAAKSVRSKPPSPASSSSGSNSRFIARRTLSIQSAGSDGAWSGTFRASETDRPRSPGFASSDSTSSSAEASHGSPSSSPSSGWASSNRYCGGGVPARKVTRGYSIPGCRSEIRATRSGCRSSSPKSKTYAMDMPSSRSSSPRRAFAAVRRPAGCPRTRCRDRGTRAWRRTVGGRTGRSGQRTARASRAKGPRANDLAVPAADRSRPAALRRAVR